jgi:alpha,alpha-trehalose phosphorylase
VTVHSCRLVSLEHRHLVAVEYEMTVDRASPVSVVSRTVNRIDRPGSQRRKRLDSRLGAQLDHRVLNGQIAEDRDGRAVLAYVTTNSKMTLTMGIEHVVETANRYETSSSVTPDLSEVVITAEAEPGVPIRIVKYVAYQTSRSIPSHDLVPRCERTLDRAVRGGFKTLAVAQRANLDRFWSRADVLITDPVNGVRAQQAVRWNLFQLAQATWRAEGAGVPAKGLTSGAYDGHYFWDTEAYVLPFLAYTQPRIARNLLRFRHSMLDRARQRAGVLELSGALFPWRTINGDEASALFQAGTAQFHINADIAYAIRRYVDVRGDPGFLLEVGAEVLVETARMWESLGFYGTDGCFHLHSVTGPDEYTTVVNDNAFTNLMARLNLNYAAETVRWMEAEHPTAHAALCYSLGLTPSEPDAWETAAASMYIPHDESRGITPQDASFLDREVWDLDATPPDRFPLLNHFHPLVIYRHQVLKQADVVMAMFLLGNEFTPEEKARNFAYYEARTVRDSSLSACTQAVLAAEVGYLELAHDYIAETALMDLRDLNHNTRDGVHIASLAGTWVALVAGLGGMRDHDGQLSFAPRLPSLVDRLEFSVVWRGLRLRVTVRPGEATYSLRDGPDDAGLELTHHGEKLTVTAAAPVTRPIAPIQPLTPPPNQPPGRAPLRRSDPSA